MRVFPVVVVLLLVQTMFGQATAETLKVMVESAVPGTDKFTAEPLVTLTLKLESRTAMAEFTKARVGEKISMRLGDKVLMEPIINEPIVQGIIHINGGFTVQSAQEIADAIMNANGSFEIDGSDK
jgi:preprotein translocase subunit SecD